MLLYSLQNISMMTTQTIRRSWYGLVSLALLSAPSLASAAATTLTDPLGHVGVNEIVRRLIQGIFGITGSVALLMFVWGGFQWLFSAGEQDRIKKGKETIKWAVLGLTVMLLAYVLVSAVLSILTEGTVV